MLEVYQKLREIELFVHELEAELDALRCVRRDAQGAEAAAQRLFAQHGRGTAGQSYLSVALSWLEALLAENQALRLLGANRAAIDAALNSYWARGESLLPHRTQEEFRAFGLALHAATQVIPTHDQKDH
jgi:hypothetical protein